MGEKGGREKVRKKWKEEEGGRREGKMGERMVKEEGGKR